LASTSLIDTRVPGSSSKAVISLYHPGIDFLQHIATHEDFVMYAAFSSVEQSILAYGNHFALYGPIPPLEIFTLEGEVVNYFMPSEPVLSATYDETSDLIAISGMDYVSVLGLNQNEIEEYVYTGERVYSIDMNPSGTYAAAISDSG